MTHDEFAGFVARAEWQFAKTMPETPHEYALRRKAPSHEEFNEAVEFIRENGYEAEFGGRTYTYYDLDGQQYWTMGSPVQKTILINRAAI